MRKGTLEEKQFNGENKVKKYYLFLKKKKIL